MNILKQLSFVTVAMLASTIPAFGGVTVNSPSNGSEVKSPFTLSATSSSCSSQSVASMGFSLDGSSDTTVVKGSSIDNTVAAGSGSHVVHVKAWGDQGASCVTDIDITVGTAATSTSQVPADATKNSNIQVLGGWKAQHDTGGSGSASGSMSVVSSPSKSGSARKFETTFSNNGDERYSVSFSDDDTALNLLYDAWVYFPSSSIAKVGNLEMDINQVMANGQNAILAMQCAGYTNTWDYTKNSGTPEKPVVTWVHSSQPCNPRSWSANTWHHVQLSYSRTEEGVVTYKSVWIDDKEQSINATVKSAFALGWGKVLQTQFQIDGVGGSGAVTAYVDDLTVYHW